MANVQLAVAGDETTQVILSVPGVQGPAGSNLPPSGTTNQVLYKQSSTDYDTAWSLVTSAMITDGTIVNGDINASAAIAGTKISPDFGSQNVITTGTNTAGSFIPTSSGAPTNGLYLPSANNVAISTNGTGRLFVDASGNVNIDSNTLYVDAVNNRVAIGISNPLQLLHLSSASAPITQITYQGVGAAQTGVVAGGAYTIGVDGGNGSTERLRITSDGKVGLGTSTPGAVLHSVGTNSGLPVTSGTTQTYCSLRLGGSNSTGIVDFGISGSENWIQSTDRTDLSQKYDLLLNPNGGRVGVGTTSVDAKLVVSDGTNINTRIGQLTLDNFTGEGAGIQFSRTTSDSSLCALGVVNGGDGDLGFFSRNNLIFATGGAINYSATSEKARIDSSGRLLVGTSSARSNVNLQSGDRTPHVQIETSTNTYNNGLSIINNSADGYAPQLTLGLSLANGIGSNGNVAPTSSAAIGILNFVGNDGDQFLTGARIEAVTDGVTGNGDMPVRLVFSTTADGASSPTERLRITSTGQVRLAGAGITFNGDTATENELDDYEEGSWSPVYVPSSGAFTTMTMSVSGARYVKIGQQVTVSAYFYSSSVDVTGASGTVSLSGLPFTTRTTQDVRYSGAIGYAVGFTTKPIDWSIDNGVTTVGLIESKTNNDFLDVADLATGTGFLNAMYFTATYFVN